MMRHRPQSVLPKIRVLKERAPFENTGAEAGARSFVQMSIIQIIESIHKWDRQNSFALSGVRINRSEIN